MSILNIIIIMSISIDTFMESLFRNPNKESILASSNSYKTPNNRVTPSLGPPPVFKPNKKP